MFDINEILHYLMQTDFMETQVFLTIEDEGGDERYPEGDDGYCYVVAARGTRAKALHTAVQELVRQWREEGNYGPEEMSHFINETQDDAEIGVMN